MDCIIDNCDVHIKSRSINQSRIVELKQNILVSNLTVQFGDWIEPVRFGGVFLMHYALQGLQP
jgi:hypothetical protein